LRPLGEQPAPIAWLSHPLTSFIGREREVAAVADMMRRPSVRLLTLTGPGGVGKTRLAVRVAERIAADFPDGVWFVDLAPVRDPALVASTIGRTFGVEETGGRPIADGIAAYLADRHGLLILDNFEHVLEAGPLVMDLLAACPALKVLTTSRAVLRLSAEHDMTVPPLASVDPERLPPLARLGEADAVRLFTERASAANADFVLTDANIAEVATLCARLDGLPLAIELAAARTRALSPRAMLRRLDQRLRLLTGGARDQPPRLRSLRDAIAWSYDLLTPEEQVFFRQMAIFVGGCTLAAAEVIVGKPDHDVLDSFEGIASLVDKSLLRQETGVDGEARYLMLETVREYGLEQLAASGEDEATRQRHAAYYLALAGRAAPDPPGGRMLEQWLWVLEAEHPNLRAVLTWLAEQGETESCLRLACFLGQLWFQHSHLSEGRRWVEQALAQATAAPAELRAEALWRAGMLANYQGDEERAIALLESGLALSRELGGTWVTPFGLLMLGTVAEDQGRYAQAAPLLEEARTVAEQLGHQSAIAYALGHLAIVAYGQGDLARAATAGAEALRLARSREDTWAAGVALRCLGLTACERGDFAAAAAHLIDALAIDLAQGNRDSIAHLYASFAVLAAGREQRDEASRLLGAAEALREVIGAALPLPERATFERAAVAARSALGDDAFAAAWAAGRALSQEEAVAITHAVAAAATIPGPAARHGLTSRELEVLRLVAFGHSNREIAKVLFISIPTVKRHLTNILGKLDLPSRSAATAYAHTHSLV
jgi:non-specific serine/threonine protein kinase